MVGQANTGVFADRTLGEDISALESDFETPSKAIC
jgi:hypothetical protein